MKFMIGCDPEIFVGDANSAKSIIGKIGGSKEMPLPMPIGEGFSMQEDNVALEFNIPPSDSKEAFTKNMSSAMDFLGSVLQDIHGLHFLKESAISFPEEELIDPAAHVFGCEPDFNAWTRRVNPRPKANDKNLRSAGGHVHVGAELNKEQKVICVRTLDLLLSVPACLMDKGELRKQLYGKAGAFRDKSYGLEYRPLSNFWIFDKRYQEWVYDNVGRALDATLRGTYGDLEQEKDNILKAVDEGHKEVAMQLVDKYNLEVVERA